VLGVGVDGAIDNVCEEAIGRGDLRRRPWHWRRDSEQRLAQRVDHVATEARSPLLLDATHDAWPDPTRIRTGARRAQNGVTFDAAAASVAVPSRSAGVTDRNPPPTFEPADVAFGAGTFT